MVWAMVVFNLVILWSSLEVSQNLEYSSVSRAQLCKLPAGTVEAPGDVPKEARLGEGPEGAELPAALGLWQLKERYKTSSEGIAASHGQRPMRVHFGLKLNVWLKT